MILFAATNGDMTYNLRHGKMSGTYIFQVYNYRTGHTAYKRVFEYPCDEYAIDYANDYYEADK